MQIPSRLVILLSILLSTSAKSEVINFFCIMDKGTSTSISLDTDSRTADIDGWIADELRISPNTYSITLDDGVLWTRYDISKSTWRVSKRIDVSKSMQLQGRSQAQSLQGKCYQPVDD